MAIKIRDKKAIMDFMRQIYTQLALDTCCAFNPRLSVWEVVWGFERRFARWAKLDKARALREINGGGGGMLEIRKGDVGIPAVRLLF